MRSPAVFRGAIVGATSVACGLVVQLLVMLSVGFIVAGLLFGVMGLPSEVPVSVTTWLARLVAVAAVGSIWIVATRTQPDLGDTARALGWAGGLLFLDAVATDTFVLHTNDYTREVVAWAWPAVGVGVGLMRASVRAPLRQRLTRAASSLLGFSFAFALMWALTRGAFPLLGNSHALLGGEGQRWVAWSLVGAVAGAIGTLGEPAGVASQPR